MALFGLKLAPQKIRSTKTLSAPGHLKYYYRLVHWAFRGDKTSTGRILKFVERHPGILQLNHCGELPNKGTVSALLQMVNLTEDYGEYDPGQDNGIPVPLDFTSWDMAKAFDSIGRHIQYAAWRRLGIPAWVAQ